jgi:Fur family ferric uptake transcriptional regulator
MTKRGNSGAGRGKRTTTQGRAIEAVFRESDHPLTVAEAHVVAAQSCPGLGIATAYRAVNRLVESEWLKEVKLPEQPVRYERQDLHHHHHFQCESCDRVLDVEATCATLEFEIPSGFRVNRHEVTFYGICPDCG